MNLKEKEESNETKKVVRMSRWGLCTKVGEEKQLRYSNSGGQRSSETRAC